MVTAKLFRRNNAQTVQLPRSMELPDPVSEVDVFAAGETRVLSPTDVAWDSWFEEPVVSDDFEREQPAEQGRGLGRHSS